MSEQCTECGNTYRSQVIWSSEITKEMVSDLSNEERIHLVFALDDAVMAIASDWAV
jgi:hypothetical protein